MNVKKTVSRPRLMGLVDAAAWPQQVEPLLQQAGVTYRSVYSGLPEEDLGSASLFLVPIDDTKAGWVSELDRLDLHMPCLSLVWSRVEIDLLAMHLRAFLIADIGDGMTALVRFFDPRNIDVMLRVWGTPISRMFMGPIERWMYRGRHLQWQRIQNDSLTGARICQSILLSLDQADINTLADHAEPDAILAAMIEDGEIDGKRPYLERFADFIPRYRQALHWGIEEPAERKIFCQHTYLYGAGFDRHRYIHALLSQRKVTDEPFSTAIYRVPAAIWREITAARSAAVSCREPAGRVTNDVRD